MLYASSNSVAERIAAVRRTLKKGVTLVCVSKFQPAEAIMEAYNAGERDFGESRVQEMVAKHEALPKDIRWHMIGHLQTNKVRAIVPFVHLIQSVDSWHLLETIEREAERIGRVVDVMIEVHVAKESSKSGFLPEEVMEIKERLKELNHVRVCGVMSMATNTEDEAEIRRCFREAKAIKTKLLTEEAQLSMGMSDDYLIAQEEGSTMVRIGTTLFGERN